ncbi:DUF1667 domain-containing protein [Thermococcus sp. M39]|uniref:DUF1667 domain-containing protein n=1 Tax=unclassified Thermococcus TaxID=2627626 RepID=UPI00143B03E7|nr:MULTISPECIES: DUF1667 domain-containing protein [unclassified Thermococcus]NJE07320.1 DUF1667 domain-containing protein [Thermococcus sp. M39]NJE12548.1 DUF1667 domain-containing protein [Thermococcus sp. LS2]
MTVEVYKFTCIICPLSCDIEVKVENGEIKEIKGYTCPRGKEWAIEEITNPKRVVMSVIKVKNGNMPTVSVKTDKPIPKTKIPELMKLLAEIEVEAPIKVGQIILENPLGLDTKIVATREVEKA